ncbi:MAG: YihY/virulence factor BrkB family protein [Proteobacteria bacterium]|nr:YihY/virulence factor BrkB family protein [Pseudomonadota bacterium]MBU4388019.1 YihY/virulence factor BrkB family protein [Pseudomonadota bacterium]MBU4420749.1 YihY/virulence factor BrkB family protein [Pseudomonadota bacterium]MBU4503314.1 YihY/virulence factor BrkB family protein [Pseudomonadota bacterium]MCG2831089.1 YihY/virulence factor BrkB family protein [Desulfobacteraceae bacterium]
MDKNKLKTIQYGFNNFLKVMRYALKRFGQEHAPEAAASMSFYTLFSLFPVILIVVAANSFILESLHVQEQILETILKFFPVASHQIISSNMQQILQARGAVGIVGVIILVWAATCVFTTLVHNLNRAWTDAPVQNIFRARLTAFSIIIFFVMLLPLFWMSKAVINLIPVWDANLLGVINISYFKKIISNVFIYIFVCMTLMTLYRWIPKTKVRWSEALGGAVFAVMAEGAATAVFSWYLRSGLSKYNLVYGSLGALISFLTWIYIINLIVLFGAHLSASIAHHRNLSELQ